MSAPSSAPLIKASFAFRSGLVPYSLPPAALNAPSTAARTGDKRPPAIFCSARLPAIPATKSTPNASGIPAPEPTSAPLAAPTIAPFAAAPHAFLALKPFPPAICDSADPANPNAPPMIPLKNTLAISSDQIYQNLISF